MAKQTKRRTAKAKPDKETVVDQAGYTVLARRYRPSQFKDLVGQEPVARALMNALENNRVAHAYLFTGARGVGKTSTARILAKALNCEKGPTPTPCDTCDICRSISAGEDVDVLEIDGASNRGIEEVRELRRNVNYRPSRARLKIYIIDEVHMLTKEAFNALLKTLEEPPPHVKFIFATTEVQKIPLTILSRCQRFDFAGIRSELIADRLRLIVKQEGMEADDEALAWIARRAGGSLRDAQSLLDQLLAFQGENEGTKRLTLEHVHELLGTASEDQVVALAQAVLEGNLTQAFAVIEEAAGKGMQLGEFLDQIIDYWRDLMIVSCAGSECRDLNISNKFRTELSRQAKSLSLDAIVAGLDVLASTKMRLRGSGHPRVLLEMAIVRLSRLRELLPLGELAQQLTEWDRTEKKTAEPPLTPSSLRPEPSRSVQTYTSKAQGKPDQQPAITELTDANLPEVWAQVLDTIGPMLRHQISKAERVAIFGPKTLVLQFSSSYNLDHCQQPERVDRIEAALKRITGEDWRIRFELVERPNQGGSPDESPTMQRQKEEALKMPLVKRAIEQLNAQIVKVEEGFGLTRPDNTDSEDDDV
ncbi:MAG: hypothetical protein KatS3mg105_0419 [Gemmatales bacterium]|nr:MAG: hypothetical protein KatS3mg105_0419 [Gemmatales bacterium]